MRPPDVVARRPAATIAGGLRTALEFIRISALGATVLIALLGTASAGGAASPASFAAAGLVAILFHVFAYVLNDVVDLEIDRTEPRRAGMPLVTGAIGPSAALAIALACVPLAGWLAAAAAPDGAAGPAIGWLALAFTGLTVYDLAGKRTPWPPLTDLVQGIGWAALLACGAWIGGGVTPLTIVLAAYVALFIVMTNGVHGSLRDLPNDGRHGIVTTATLLGARMAGERRVLSRALVAYAWLLQFGLLGLAGLALLVDVPAAGRLPAALAGAVLALLAVLLLAAATRRVGPPGDELDGLGGADGDLLAAGMLHLLVGLAIPIAIVAARTPPAIVLAMTAAYLLPVVAHGWLAGAGKWLRGVSAEVLRPASDLFRLTRPHNALAAGLAVALGAHLGGVATLLAEPVVRAGFVAALVVAGANVLNDRLDVAEDRLNHPERPIAAGRIGPRSGIALAVALSGAGVLLGLTFGSVPGVAVAGLVIASAAYSAVLKRTVLLGNAVVAALAAATIVFGALILGRPTAAMAIGAGVAFVSVLASEILISVLDREGDALAGRTTIGTVLSVAAGLRLHGALLAGLMALVAVVPLAGAAPPAFLPAALAGIVLPNAIVLLRLRDVRTAGDVLRAYPVSKIAWFTGIAALAFLA